MANTKSAEKRARQSLKRHARNKSVLSSIKTARKRALKALVAGDTMAANQAISRFASVLDKAAKRGIIHRNAASRGKSRMALAQRKMRAAAPAGS